MARDSIEPGGECPSAGRVAARVLASRLGQVHDLLRAAADGDDEECVHALRVATRRASAAIDGFQPILPADGVAWFQSRLGRLRHAAGRVRDLDVILSGLRAARRHDSPPRDGVDGARAIGAVERKRAKSRGRLARAIDRAAGRRGWRDHLGKLVGGIGGRRATMRFDRFAEQRLGLVIGRFCTAAAVRADDADALHAIRIRAKRARYALEIFAPVPSPPRQRCLKTLVHLQDLAGRCIDQATAAARFARWARRADARVDRRTFRILAAAAVKAAEVERRRTVAWLTPARLRRIERDVARLPLGPSLRVQRDG